MRQSSGTVDALSLLQPSSSSLPSHTEDLMGGISKPAAAVQSQVLAFTDSGGARKRAWLTSKLALMLRGCNVAGNLCQ